MPDDDAATVLEAVERDLEAIDAAMQRLDVGTYGICEVCRAAIAEATLEADPTATRCVPPCVAA